MKVQVLEKRVVRADVHGVVVFFNGEKEVREVIKKLTDALFDLAKVQKMEVCHGVSE